MRFHRFSLLGSLVFVAAYKMASVFPADVAIDLDDAGSSNRRDEIMLGMPSAYGIKVLVEQEGFYIGEELMGLNDVVGWIDKAKHVHNVRSVVVKPSTTAKYGDVVALLGLLRKDKSYYSTMSIRPLPTGRRMNAWAYYKYYCCGSDDVLSEEYKSYIHDFR